MLDINLFRKNKGGDPERIRESQRRRGADPALVDRVIELDEAWVEAHFRLNQLSKEKNALSKQFGQAKRKGEDMAPLTTKLAEIKEQQKELSEREKELIEKRNQTLSRIGNIVAEDVPTSLSEEDNVVVHTFGEQRSEPWMLNHAQILEKLGAVDCVRGRRVAGNRGYFLVGPGVLLNLALIQYGVRFLATREQPYVPLQTPVMMRKDVMERCAQLEEFDEMLYKVSGSAEERYLIATSEQPIAARHAGEMFAPDALPVRYSGVSSCFRKETGRHGEDTLGIFRVHQFEKVEQFCITKPGESWATFRDMIGHSRAFFESLGVPYRVVSIVSGELNNAAAKKYDLEGWFPAGASFRELVSCSNCLDYQARSLDVRMGVKGKKRGAGGAPEYVHMLNSTLVATGRAICAIVENHQTRDGVVVPEPLREFVGRDFLPYAE